MVRQKKQSILARLSRNSISVPDVLNYMSVRLGKCFRTVLSVLVVSAVFFPPPAMALSSRLNAARVQKTVYSQIIKSASADEQVRRFTFAADADEGLLPLEIEITQSKDAELSDHISFFVRPAENSDERIHVMNMSFSSDGTLYMIEVYFGFLKTHPELIGRSKLGATLRQGVWFLLLHVCNKFENNIVLNVHGTPNIKLLALFRPFLTSAIVFDFPVRQHPLELNDRNWLHFGFLNDLKMEFIDVDGRHYRLRMLKSANMLHRYTFMLSSGDELVSYDQCRAFEKDREILFYSRSTGKLLMRFDKRTFYVTYLPLADARIFSCTTGARMHSLEGRIVVPEGADKWRIIDERDIEQNA